MASRLWKIRESFGERGGKEYDDPELQEAYECGYNDCMEDMEEGGSSMGNRMGYRMGDDMGDRMGYRMGNRSGGSRGGYMGERRMRDSRGRYM